MSQTTPFVPYTKHQDLEKPGVLESELAKNGRLEDCMETLLANRRWEQYVDAGCILTGRVVRFPEGCNVYVVRVERSQNPVTECFVLVSVGGRRFPVTTDTKLMMENPNV